MDTAQTNRILKFAYSWLGVALVAAVVAAANFTSTLAYFRLDFTGGKIYSISGATKNLVSSLRDPVIVQIFASKELPPQIAEMKNYVADVLKEYSAASSGKIKTVYTEIDETTAAKEEALKNGILPVRFDIYSSNRYEQREGFFGLTLQYLDQKEAMPFINDTSGLEYDLTSRIKSMVNPKKNISGYVRDFGTVSPWSQNPGFARFFEARNELRPVDLAGVAVDSGIASDIQTLFIIGPQEPLTDKELFILDQYLLSGRSLFVALDTNKVNTASFAAVPNITGLEPFLAHHGITVSPQMVMDEQNQPIQIARSQGMFMFTNIVAYPPFIVSTKLSKNNPATKDLRSIIFPYASPVALSAKASGAQQETLAESSKASWLAEPEAGRLNLDPFGELAPRENAKTGPFALAACVENGFSPFFAQPPQQLKPKTMLSAAAARGRLAVVSTSKFLVTDYRLPDSNFMFFLNLTDWLNQDSGLISIRSKTSAFRPLDNVSPAKKKLIRRINIFLPPLLAVLIGLWRWRAKNLETANNKKLLCPAAVDL